MAQQHTILVAVNASPASLEGVATACAYGRQRKSKVYVVHVVEVARSMALNAEMDREARRGEQILRKAEDQAAAAGYPVTGELLQAREAGQAIVDEARERDADVVVLAVGPRRVSGEHGLGRTAEFVLRQAGCDVWLIRQGEAASGAHEHE